MTPSNIVSFSAKNVESAVNILSKGGLVAFATETVYGLGADATNGLAVAKIFESKGRPQFNPLILHVSDLKMAERFAEFSTFALNVAEHCWPGPVSLVLPIRTDSNISELVTAGLQTVAIRVPQNKNARELLKKFGGAIAAPSANPSGKISPTTAMHVAKGLGDKVDLILDDGACPVGLESTILHIEEEKITLLRAGGFDHEKLPFEIQTGTQNPNKPQSPGQLLSHYAPRLPLRMNVTKPAAGELFLGFGDMSCDANLSTMGNLQEAAANLFALLHILDEQGQKNGMQGIAVAPIPNTGLGLAINDRLKRAATP